MEQTQFYRALVPLLRGKFTVIFRESGDVVEMNPYHIIQVRIHPFQPFFLVPKHAMLAGFYPGYGNGLRTPIGYKPDKINATA
jgi:hypothetical protein